MKRANLFRPLPARKGPGYVLIVALVFLLAMTLLSVTMFRSFGIQEKIAGNTRDKQRAFEAAQSALQYGEWWLGQGHASSGATCNGVLNGNVTPSQMQVCSNALLNPGALPWATRTDYLPPSMTVASGGGLTGSGDINYYSKPSLYISYLGLSPDGLSMLYSVAGAGYGGNPNTVAVVQSTYAVGAGTKDLGQP